MKEEQDLNQGRLELARHVRRKKEHPTFGLLIAGLIDPVFQHLWLGAADAARAYDANLICFAGGRLQSPHGFEAQANVVYDLVNAEQIDGLVFCSNTLQVYAGPKALAQFIRRYHPLPMVSVESAFQAVPSVLMDEYRGMQKAITHLVDVHGCRHIAFVPGPEGHSGMRERYRAYVDTLEDAGLFDPNLVTPPALRVHDASPATVLLDERDLRPQTDLDAIAGASDGLALKAARTLQARGIRVPDDVAIIGFDNIARCRSSTPPLTTVRAPFYEMGRQAVEMLLELLSTGKSVERVTLPTELVIRRSCGCPGTPVAQLPTDVDPGSIAAPLHTAAKQQDAILLEMVQAAACHFDRFNAEEVETRARRLLESFIAEAEGNADGGFLRQLDRIVQHTLADGDDIAAWQGALSTLRLRAIPGLSEGARGRGGELWQRARTTLYEAAQRAKARRALRIEQQTHALREISHALVKPDDECKLIDALAEHLPHLGIPSACLSLYENPQSPAAWSRLMLAYDECSLSNLAPEGRRFLSLHVAPKGVLPQDRQYCMVVEPLYLHENQLGFALLEVGPREGAVYKTLREELSSALDSTRALMARRQAEKASALANTEVEKQIAGRTADLRREITRRECVEDAQKHMLEQLAALSKASRVVTTSLDLDQVLTEIVSLAGEIADADFTCVGLLDGRGNIGQSAENLEGIPALKHRIRERGLTHWVLRSRQAAVVDEIDADGFITPDLGEGAPRTISPCMVEAGIRSLVGLPLMVKENLLGVLFLHSRQADAFGGQLFLLVTFANQVAIAIENARLFEGEQQQTQRLGLLADIARAAATTFDADALLQAVAESLCQRTPYPYVGLFTLDEDHMLTLRSQSGIDPAMPGSTAPGVHRHSIDVGITGYVARSGEPYLVPDVLTDPYFYRPANSTIRSALCVPICDEGRVTGTVDAESDQPAGFDTEDLALLEAVADTVAVGLRNIRLHQETQHRVQELTLLNSISAGFSKGLDLETLIDSTVKDLSRLMDADWACFIATDLQVDKWEVAHKHVRTGITRVSTPHGTLRGAQAELEVLSTGRLFAVSDAATDQRVAATRETYRSMGMRSILLVPVRIEQRLYGALGCGYCSQPHTWQPDETRLLQAVAHQFELGLENVHLFREVRSHTEELAAALARLEEMDRIKDEFIQNVSHELRSPLALVRGYAEMLNSGELGELTPEQQSPVAVIARRARMLGALVEDITLILEAEASPPKPELVPLDKLAHHAVEDFGIITQQANLILQAEIAADLPPVKGSPTYLRRVLDNLLGNAVKFTPKGGTVTLRLHREDAYTVLRVSDTGVGIPPDQLEHIFQRFYQVDGSARRRYGGVGLGLALVREIAEIYGGHVTVESEVGQGSTFTVFLPVSCAEEMGAAIC